MPANSRWDLIRGLRAINVECGHSAGNQTLYSGITTFFACHDVAAHCDVY